MLLSKDEGVSVNSRGPGRRPDREQLLGALLPRAWHCAGWLHALGQGTYILVYLSMFLSIYLFIYQSVQ